MISKKTSFIKIKLLVIFAQFKTIITLSKFAKYSVQNGFGSFLSFCKAAAARATISKASKNNEQETRRCSAGGTRPTPRSGTPPNLQGWPSEEVRETSGGQGRPKGRGKNKRRTEPREYFLRTINLSRNPKEYPANMRR